MQSFRHSLLFLDPWVFLWVWYTDSICLSVLDYLLDLLLALVFFCFGQPLLLPPVNMNLRWNINMNVFSKKIFIRVVPRFCPNDWWELNYQLVENYFGGEGQVYILFQKQLYLYLMNITCFKYSLISFDSCL